MAKNREFRHISPEAMAVLQDSGAFIRQSTSYPSITLVDFPEGTRDSSFNGGSYPGVQQVSGQSYVLPDGTPLSYEVGGVLTVK